MNISEFMTSLSLSSVSLRFIFLFVMSLLLMVQVVRTRIGSLKAIAVKSYPRLILGLVLCNAAYLFGHQLLLLTEPNRTYLRFIFFLVGSIVTYPFYGIFVSFLGFICDGGHALCVLTSRYKPNYPSLSRYVDLTKNHGETAQLIPRGAVAAYLLLLLATSIVSLRELLV